VYSLSVSLVQKNFLRRSEKDSATKGILKGKIFRLLSNRLKVMRIGFPNWRRNSFQTPTVTAAMQATTEIPIVMDAGDPVGMGLVQSLAKPGGNVTGVSAATAEVGPKNLQLLQQIVPSLRRVALFLNATDPFRKPWLDHNLRGADQLGIELKPIFINGVTELASAFNTATSEKLEAVLIQPSLPITRAAAFALDHHLPAASPTRGFVKNGGLMSYCANYEEVW
jgi:putative ABC transport system substrate-binding protein